MKAFKIVCILLFLILTLLLSCSKKKPPEPEPTKYKWTILGYFDGNNSQDQAPDGGSYVLKDLDSLEQIDSTEEVQVLVMLGSAKTDGNCKYYHVKTDSSEVVDSLGNKDMSDPTSLRDFISYGVQNYPADHYMLIINDHGRGWKGICYDTINGANNWMSLPDLSYAFSGFEFDIIWFYTPSMATVEVAYQIMDRAQYMIASQFKRYPDNIMGSTEWLPYLTDNPNIDATSFAMKVTRAIYNAAQSISPYKHVHSVLIHLPKIAQVATNVSNLGQDLIDSTGYHWNEVWDVWKVSHSYDDCDSASVHLREFAWKIHDQSNLNSAIKDAARVLATSIDDALLAEFMYPPYHEYTNLGGISIHFPWNQDLFDSTSYAQLDFVTTNWHSFISTFIQSFSSNCAGTLNITSTPTGAKVFLNDVYTGYKTNTIISGILPGSYTLRLSKEGYLDYVRLDFEIKPRVPTSWSATLDPIH